MEMKVEMPPKAPTLEVKHTDGIVNVNKVTAIRQENKDLYKEKMKTYTKKLDKFEKGGMMAYMMVIRQYPDGMLHELECNFLYKLVKE